MFYLLLYPYKKLQDKGLCFICVFKYKCYTSNTYWAYTIFMAIGEIVV